MAPQDAAALQASTQAAQSSGTNATGMVVGENPISPPSGTAPANPVPSLPPGALTASGGAATPNVQQISGLGGPVPNPELGNSTGFMSPGGTPAATSPFSNLLSGIGDFTKNNQMLSYGILQAGGSLLTGAFSTLTPAQVTALDAQAAANNAASALTAQQTANLAMPKSVASSSPVTGAPAQLVPSPAGFINQAPRPQVTGVPA
jgi:hypothetical protein